MRGRVAGRGAVTGALLASAALLVPTGVAAAPAPGADRAVATDVASDATVVGTVERLHLDRFGVDAGNDDLVTVVHDGARARRVPSETLRDVPDRTTVRLRYRDAAAARAATAAVTGAAATDPHAGIAVDGIDVLAFPSSAQRDDASASADTAAGLTVHEVTVVPVTWAGLSPDSTAPADLAAVVDGAVSSYWSQVTAGRVSFRTTVASGWVTTSLPACVSGDAGTNAFPFWNEVATAVGFVSAPGRHLVVYFPATSACGGTVGLGSIGSGLDSGGRVWTNGRAALNVIGHELGHNLGLGHSDELGCTVSGTRVTDAAPGACTAASYRDLHDIMALAWSNVGYLNAVHLLRLGVLDPAAVTDVTTSATVTLAPLASGAGRRVVRITDGGTTYLLEYRAPVGLDAWISPATGWVDPGVGVRKVFDAAALSGPASHLPARDTLLLDADPATADTSFASMRTVLPVGQEVPLADGRLGITVMSQADDGAAVAVRVGAVPVPPTSPPPTTPPPTTPPTTSPPPTTPPPASSPASGAGPLAVSGLRAQPTTGALRVVGRTVLVPFALRFVLGDDVAAPTRTSVQGRLVVASGGGAGPHVVVARLPAGTTSWRSTRLSVAVTDAGGRTGSGSATVRSRYVAESALAAAGRWTTGRNRAAVGGAERVSTVRGARLSITATVAGVGVVAARGPGRGVVDVVVDGRRAGVVDLAAPRARPAVVVWSRVWSTAGHHVVVLVNRGVNRRPLVALDGVVVVR